eukprot:2779881-Prymnesium_polylepis.1
MPGLPVNLSSLDSFVVSHPSRLLALVRRRTGRGALGPPPTGAGDVRRARFIYDFFLTAERPRGGEA